MRNERPKPKKAHAHHTHDQRELQSTLFGLFHLVVCTARRLIRWGLGVYLFLLILSLGEHKPAAFERENKMKYGRMCAAAQNKKNTNNI